MIRQVLSSVVRKPATVRYPFVKVTMPSRFRGKLRFFAEQCVGCRLCMRDCPSNAIQIRKVGDKLFEADIDMAKCIYCAQCVDNCPKKALEATGQFELAQLARDKLKQTYRGQPTDSKRPPDKP
jgi:formate hydrogenlyase subunit 6/NADH:ubiquinone oxidoreductase subunit I